MVLFLNENHLMRIKITLYEGVDALSIEFPHRKIIEEIQETGIFRKIMLSFMKGRDENYIA